MHPLRLVLIAALVTAAYILYKRNQEAIFAPREHTPGTPGAPAQAAVPDLDIHKLADELYEESGVLLTGKGEVLRTEGLAGL